MTHHLYPLGFTCRIEHVFFDEAGEEVDATILRAMLSEPRPTRLELNANLMKEDWVAALCEKRTPQSRSLP